MNMTSRERVFHGTIASEHVAQLFDETESMIVSMAAFLGEGWQRGDNLLIVARPAHWALTSGELAARGCPVADAIADGRLVALDAATTMATFMVNGEPDRAKFELTVGAIVERLSAGGACGITIYGEMVDLLAAQGNFTGAEKLEALWNDLSSRCSLRLLCGYSSSHFGDERTAAHLNAICGAHMAMRARPADLLAAWLLANRRSRYHLERQ
jgi:hypothetical protein